MANQAEAADQPLYRLDLTQFASVDDAIAKVEAAWDYDRIAKRFLSIEGLDPVALPVLFFSSMVNRCNSLHGAIVREMRENNPHAVFPLIRSYAEGAALLVYVHDHIAYIEAVIDDPNQRNANTPARLRVGKLVAYAVKHAAPGFKAAHDELTDFTHFGSSAMWSPFVPSDDGTSYSWTSYPRWKNDEQALIAAASSLEVSEASHLLLTNFGRTYLAGTLDPPVNS